MLKIDLSRQTRKFLESLPAKHARQVAEHLLALRSDPESSETAELKGYTPYRRMKSGEYRIIYYIGDDTVFVTLIGKRNDDEIYKQLQRLLRGS